MPKLLHFRFPEGRYFLNCDNTELKRSSNFFFCFWRASLGGGGLRIEFPGNLMDRMRFVKCTVKLKTNSCLKYEGETGKKALFGYFLRQVLL